MIRHVVMFRLNESATPEAVECIRAALAALPAPGRTAFTMGPDLGLHPANMDVALVADFEDADAFAAYNVDPEHDRIRKDLIAPVTERLERCQFTM
jgi:hypothetical protein